MLRDLVLRMTWDDEEHPSVEVPLGDFFCCGFGKECTVNSYPIAVVPARGMNSYFSMPFTKRAKIELINEHKNPIPHFSIRLITVCTTVFRILFCISMQNGTGSL